MDRKQLLKIVKSLRNKESNFSLEERQKTQERSNGGTAGLDVELTESVTDSFSLFSFFLSLSPRTHTIFLFPTSLSYFFFSFSFFSSLTKGLPSFKGGVMTQGSGVKILSFSPYPALQPTSLQKTSFAKFAAPSLFSS